MLLAKLQVGFCNAKSVRFYNNAFDWSNDKWNLSAEIRPPQLQMDGYTARILKQSSLNLSIC